MLKEHEAARWLEKEKLYSVQWLPADVSLTEKTALRLRKEHAGGSDGNSIE